MINTLKPTWLDLDAVKKLRMLFDNLGMDARFVGGVVRDFLWGIQTQSPQNAQKLDFDIAFNGDPNIIKNYCQKHAIKCVDVAIDYGTLIIVIDGIPFECTALRRDQNPNGRHCDIILSSNFTQDASRRDFTINAVYMDFDGQITDPLGDGIHHIKQRKLCFIGDADARITEDYLRILRFIRFGILLNIDFDIHGAHSFLKTPAYHQTLAKLSPMRISSEFEKICAFGKAIAPFFEQIAPSGLLSLLPGWKDDYVKQWHQCNIALGHITAITHDTPIDMLLLRMASMISLWDHPKSFYRHFPVARHLKSTIQDILKPAPFALSDAAYPYWLLHHYGGKENAKTLIMHKVLLDIVNDDPTVDHSSIMTDIFGELQKHDLEKTYALPVNGCDIKALLPNDRDHQKIAELLDKARHFWLKNHMSPDHKACLAFVKEAL